MLKFLVYDDNGAPARDFRADQAFLMGADELPVQGAVRLDQGVLSADRGSGAPTAINVLFSVPGDIAGGSAGRFMLQTCLLADRDEPYLLSLELARHRIMLFLNKLEDWDLFELGSDHPVMVALESARLAYVRALSLYTPGSWASAPEADKVARQALSLALAATQKLTLHQAERGLVARASGKAFERAAEHVANLTGERPASTPDACISGEAGVVHAGVAALGVAASPTAFAEPLQRYVLANCDFLAMPMRWVDLEPEEGSYAFSTTDRWIEWAVRSAKLPIVGGPLIDFRPSAVPEWLYIWENDYETLRELVFEHVQAVVTRYRRTVGHWTVVSGLHANTHFRLSLEQIMDLTRICVQLIRRKLQPKARIAVEITQPWGDYHGFNRRSFPPLAYAETLSHANVEFDSIALRIQLGQPEPGQTTRDLTAISTLLDRYALLEKPISVVLGVPSAPTNAGTSRRAATREEDDDLIAGGTSTGTPIPTGPTLPPDPGSLGDPWSDATQADWLAKAVAVCASKTFVRSICWQELMDPATGGSLPPEMPAGGLLTQSGASKPAATRFAQMRQAIRDGKLPK
ncbi:MAG: endo-1,4-beta-xylanase [Planctomycetota bacterium]|nr:endo-1,4-beta-xylanase [Planctomycetota bacterium]